VAPLSCFDRRIVTRKEGRKAVWSNGHPRQEPPNRLVGRPGDGWQIRVGVRRDSENEKKRGREKERGDAQNRLPQGTRDEVGERRSPKVLWGAQTVSMSPQFLDGGGEGLETEGAKEMEG